jgi:3-hydroxybutyryl-CoA dehydrogenase
MTRKNLAKSPIGIVGLGLMGSSIVAALVASGHPVKAIAPIPADLDEAPVHIQNNLHHCKELSLLSAPGKVYDSSVTLTEDYSALEKCFLVIECVTEDEEIKASVYAEIERHVPGDAIMGTNTSSLPISRLQKHLKSPQRFLGIHWAEPAYATRFMEITCGEQTEMTYANRILQIAQQDWQKEPTLLHKDIRGFVANRLMYAAYREGLALREKGVASLEDLDKAFRYGVGSWMTIMGLFRRMDYLGLDKYAEMLENLLPELSNSQEVPEVMQEMVQNKAKGIHNLKGLYSYSKEEADKWEEAFSRFNREMYRLAASHPHKSNTK